MLQSPSRGGKSTKEASPLLLLLILLVLRLVMSPIPHIVIRAVAIAVRTGFLPQVHVLLLRNSACRSCCNYSVYSCWLSPLGRLKVEVACAVTPPSDAEPFGAYVDFKVANTTDQGVNNLDVWRVSSSALLSQVVFNLNNPVSGATQELHMSIIKNLRISSSAACAC